MEIKRVLTNKKQYLELLLLADEQESMIDRYLGAGDMYVLEEAGQALGVCVVLPAGNASSREQRALELKNLAVAPERQGQGLGRFLVEELAAHYGGEYSELIVGTGDSPLTLGFYERCGFERFGRVRNFFVDNYEQPIYEAGRRLVDMIYLRRHI